MQFEKRERGPEVGLEIKTKENNLANWAKKLESKIGLGAAALFITTSAMAEKAWEQKIIEPEKTKVKLEEVAKINETKPILLEQIDLVKKAFPVIKIEKGEIKTELPKVEIKKPEAPEAKPEIKLTEKEEVEKKSFPG